MAKNDYSDKQNRKEQAKNTQRDQQKNCSSKQCMDSSKSEDAKNCK